LADIHPHLQTFRGWQGGNAVSKPRHPLISLKIYRIPMAIRLCGPSAVPITRIFPATLGAGFAKISTKQGVARFWHLSATLRLPATPIPVLRLISLRIYACVTGERETIHAQASAIER